MAQSYLTAVGRLVGVLAYPTIRLRLCRALLDFQRCLFKIADAIWTRLMDKPFLRNGVYYFRKAVPDGLRAMVGKREVKLSLKTADLEIAKRRYRDMAADVAKQWTALLVEKQESQGGAISPRSDPAVEGEGPQELPHRVSDMELVAHSGALYRRIIERHANNPGRASHWEQKLNLLQPALPDRLREPGVVQPMRTRAQMPVLEAGRRLGPDVREYLKTEGIVLDWEAQYRLYPFAATALAQAYRYLIKRARGDYRPDPDADRFPRFEDLRLLSSLNWNDLFQLYIEEAQPAGTTIKRQRGVLRAFFQFLGHDDPSRVTKADARRWKRHLIAGEKQRQTIRDADIAHPRAFFGWAADDDFIKENPFEGIRIRVRAKAKLREKAFTLEEAERILHASLECPQGRMTEESRAARRWIPWICAYTGARINEITQARAEDVFLAQVRGADPVWMMRITPEAGSVKDRDAREVALHPHLLEQGFLEYVRDRDGKRLFFDPSRARGGSESNPQYAKVGERLAHWVRHDVGIHDRNVKPNHGWRHLFRSHLLAANVNQQVIDYIDGHAPRTVGETYGSVWPQVSFEAVSKIPPYLHVAIPVAKE